MCDSVVEIVQLTFVTLITHEALATVAGTVTVTLHGNGAHWVTVTGWERTAGWEHKKTGEQRWTCVELELLSCVICVSRCIRGLENGTECSCAAWSKVLYLCNLVTRIQRSPRGKNHTVSPPLLHDTHTALWLDDTRWTMSQSGYTCT